MEIIPHIILMLEGFSSFLDETCDANCDKWSPIGDWRVERIKCSKVKDGCFPNSEQLKRLCPQTLQFLNCKSSALEDCEEFAATPKTNLTILTKYSINIENIVRDLCNVNSPFHDVYVSNVNCYQGMYYMITDLCWKLFNQINRQYLEYLDLTHKDVPQEVKCLMIDYQDACLAQRFEDFCGKGAQRIFVTTQRVYQGILNYNCSEVDEESKLIFFSFLEKMWNLSFKETFGIV